MNKPITAQSAIDERAKYIAAFNSTMVKIWKEQITLLGVIDTGRLLNSPISVATNADNKIIKEFMAESLGREFVGILSDAIDAKKFRANF